MLELDWKVALFAIINFVVLVTLLKKFLYKPVLNMLDRRRQTIDQALDQAAQARQLAAGTEEQLQARQQEAREEAAAILAEARAQAEAERQRLLDQAREEAERLSREEAERRALEQAQAEQELQKQAAALTLAAAERLLGQNLTEGQQRQLLDQYIREAGEPA